MTAVLTAQEMKSLEQAAMEGGGWSGLELMERAGLEVVGAIFKARPDLGAGARRAVVLCGPGNNGGDGYVIARMLADRGWRVAVFSSAPGAVLPPDARTNRERWGGNVGSLDQAFAALADGTADLVIDALFGIGLTRTLGEEFRDIARLMAEPAGEMFRAAVDIPSGLQADSGQVLDYVMPADLTVTFHSANPGHYLCANSSIDEVTPICGELVVVDIGLRAGTPIANLVLNTPPRHVARKDATHKYQAGACLVIGGEKPGAARLAAEAALRIGAGVVTLGVPDAAQPITPLALMSRQVATVADLDDALVDTRLRSLCIGPGHGGGDLTRDMVRAACTSGKALVLDADGLTCFENHASDLFDMLPGQAVLTPHAGEFARLFPDFDAGADRLGAVRAAARRAGCTVLLKGKVTLIASATGHVVINDARYERHVPWLATAGAGDVLAGMIAGLMARGYLGAGAAHAAAWLHVDCARRFGPGLIADDLAGELPGIFREWA